MIKVTFVLSANSSCHWNAAFLLPHLNTFHLLLCKSLSDLTLLKCFASQSHLKITANHNLCHSLKLLWQQIVLYPHHSTRHIFKLSHLLTLTHKTFDTLASVKVRDIKEEFQNLHRAALFLQAWSANFNEDQWILKKGKTLKSKSKTWFNLSLTLMAWLCIAQWWI